MPRPLKVFRTAAGFDDAYVAAPSRAAALRAWGADRDLFARGIAEEVADPVLTAEPLSRPGEVIRRSRGTAAEQLAASPPTGRQRRLGQSAGAQAEAASGAASGKVAPAKVAPDRSTLDSAEAALERAEAAARAVAREQDDKAAALARERRAAERAAAALVRRAELARDAARRAYERALADA